MGYELNLLALSEDELKEVAAQIVRYKEIRRLVQFGQFSRLMSPFEGNACAWQASSPDGSEALVWFFKPYAEAEEAYLRVYPVGLEEQAMYTDRLSGLTLSGAMVMHMGLTVAWKNGDHFAQMWHLVRCE